MCVKCWLQPAVLRHCRHGWGRLGPNGEVKSTPFVWLAFDPHRTTHQLGKTATDGKPQARATILAGGRGINLTERVKQSGQAVRRYSDTSIPYRKMEHVSSATI